MIVYNATQQRIADQLAGMELVHGKGNNSEHACSMVAVNLGLTGRFTDVRPDCVSPVIHRWVVEVQDQMPLEMMHPDDAHGARWRKVLPLVAGTANSHDAEERSQWRRQQLLILEWMWRCLSAPDGGVPSWVPAQLWSAWQVMLRDRTAQAIQDVIELVEKRDDLLTVFGNVTAFALVAVNESSYVNAVFAVANAAVASGDLLDWWRHCDPAGMLLELVG